MKERPEEIFRRHGGQLRMSEAIECGITRYMLYSLRDKGDICAVWRDKLALGVIYRRWGRNVGWAEREVFDSWAR